MFRFSKGLVLLVGLQVFWIFSCADSSGIKGSIADESQKNYRFTAGSSALRIPFEEDEGHIFLQVRVNDSRPLWFGLDTGAIRSIIDVNYARTLGLRFEGSQQVGGAGGQEEAAIINGVSFKFPGAELINQRVWALPLQALADANGREMAGIIGYDLFSHFVVDVDYADGYINLYEPGTYRYRGNGEIIPLSIEQGEIYVPAKVTIAGLKTFDGEFVIDTGGNSTLLLEKAFVVDNKLLDFVKPVVNARGGGVGGEFQMSIGRAKSLQVGRFVFDNPITALIKVGEIAEAGKTGNIGGKFLRRFRIIFDYSRKQMILEPNRYLKDPEELDMSGVALASEGPTYSVIKVARVRPDSAGARADLRAGDEIVAVDSHQTKTLSLAKIRKMFREEGREYSLSIKRGDPLMTKKIKLVKLI